jgi:hypothetical protein
MCSIGYHVSQFNTSECVAVPEVLLYVTENRVQGLAPDSTGHHSSLFVPTAGMGQPTSLAFLAAEDLVFWADCGVGEVWSMKRYVQYYQH